MTLELPLKQTECLNPTCRKDLSRNQGSRGLCAACYKYAHSAVKSGAVTWEVLENAGKVLRPFRNIERSAKNWLLEGIEIPETGKVKIRGTK